MKSNRKLLTPAPNTKAPPRNRWLKWLAGGLALYSLLGFLVLPAIIKWQLRKQLPTVTHRQVELKQVRMNPFALSLTVRGLALTETNGTAFAAFDELYVNFQLSSVFRGAWTFGEIRLTHPTANLIRLADGKFNFSNLTSANTPPATNAPTRPPAILIQSLLVTNAIVTFVDRTTPETFRAAYGPINVALSDFTTRPAEDGPYTFVATTEDGEAFAWSGQFSVNPVRSSGQFKLTGISPTKYSPYLAQFTTVRVPSGQLDVGASYRMNAANTPIELEVTNATVAIRNLLVKPLESDVTLLAINQFVITNTSASLTGHVARVGLVALNGGSILLGRETNGQPSFLNYLIPRANETAAISAPGPNSSSTKPASWRFDLDELAINRFNVAVEDRSTLPVGEIGLNNIALNLKGLSNQTNAPIDLALTFDWRDGGGAQITTRGTVLPPDLTNTLAISNLALAPLQPWLAQHLNLVVHSGGLNMEARAHFNPATTPQLHFAGDVGITNFSSSDTIAYHELAVWENLTLRGLDLRLQTNGLTIEEVKFTGARNNLVVSSNGVLNVGALAKLPATTNEIAIAPTTNAPPREMFPIRVAKLTLEHNSFRFADDSLLRRFEMHIEEINGTVSNVVLPGVQKATVDIRGKTSALAPFEIGGKVTPDPQNLFVDLKVAFTNTDLTALSAYTEKFVGRPLNKGKLTTELRYHIENRALTAANIVGLDQLTFGARNDSPDATKLPVKLAVGLLKDIHSRIDLDLPVTGSLDDPSFSVGGLVLSTLKNLIFRIASSPFSLLGALAGGGEELQFVEFAPGQTTLDASQTNKLMKLTKALEARPALSLEISATFDAGADVDSLGRQKVLARMKTLRLEEIIARGKPAPALSELKLEGYEYDRLLRKTYKATFNTTPERALREARAAILATNNLGEIAAPQPVAKTFAQQKGAEILSDRSKSLTQLAVKARSTGTSAITAASAKPKTERELVRDELEQRLATTAPVTPDEIRALMQQRIEVVQKFLVEAANISGERVLTTAPKPEDPNRQGAARVVFSLD